MSKKPQDADRRGKGLGRGLSELFGDGARPQAGTAANTAKAPVTLLRDSQMVAIETLQPGRFQPRRVFDETALNDLAHSIRDKGLLQPVLVRRLEGRAAAFEIVAGERRWRAAQKAQLHQIPVVIKDLSDRDALEIGLVENVQRQDLNKVEEATAYRRLIDEFGHTQEQVAAHIGKSRSHIANLLRVLTLPQSVIAALESGALDLGHAKLLVGRSDAAELAKEIIAKGLSVRETEKHLQALAKEGQAKAAKTPSGKEPARGESADARALARDLSELLGLKVTILSQGESGAVQIAYRTLEQLDDLCERLRGRGPLEDNEDPL